MKDNGGEILKGGLINEHYESVNEQQFSIYYSKKYFTTRHPSLSKLKELIHKVKTYGREKTKVKVQLEYRFRLKFVKKKRIPIFLLYLRDDQEIYFGIL